MTKFSSDMSDVSIGVIWISQIKVDMMFTYNFYESFA